MSTKLTINASHSSQTSHSLMIHTDSHSVEDIILNPDIFTDISTGDYIHITEYDSAFSHQSAANNQTPKASVILQVKNKNILHALHCLH